MAEAQARRYWSWGLANLLPERKRYEAAWKWLWTVGPHVACENGKEWVVGFNFYLFAFCVWYQAKSWEFYGRFTGLEIFWTPTQWLPSRLQPGDCIFRHSRRVGRYNYERDRFDIDGDYNEE